RAVKTFLGFRARDDDKNLIRRHLLPFFFVSIFKTLDASDSAIFGDALAFPDSPPTKAAGCRTNGTRRFYYKRFRRAAKGFGKKTRSP
ncbi:MAG: hypothetical protein IJE97_14880, partial [Thermoguttaceae bacterium]|nr:hypothetical protein [Thermoguttaceae bacterium]